MLKDSCFIVSLTWIACPPSAALSWLHVSLTVEGQSGQQLQENLISALPLCKSISLTALVLGGLLCRPLHRAGACPAKEVGYCLVKVSLEQSTNSFLLAQLLILLK
jgi:hypothetical protein